MRRSALVVALLATAGPSVASETINYSYDARGRLVQVSRSGTVNNGVSACYSYDKADNRTNVTVATSNCSTAPSDPSFSINDVSVTEGGSLVFTVTKTGTTSSSFSVNYATANGTALVNDYIAKSGTLTFTSAQTSQTISVATNTDILTGEEDETVFVNLSGATTGSTIADSQGVGTIINVCGSSC